MKKYLSVFAYFLRSNLYKLITIISAMSLAQFLTFSYILKKDYSPNNDIDYLLSVEKLLEYNNLIPLIFAVAFSVLTALICLNGTEFSSKTGYTLRRLRITEKEAVACNAVSNIILYSIFFLSEVIITFIICIWHLEVSKNEGYPYYNAVSNQSLFLSYYRSEFLHSLMPLSDILKHITNIVSVVSMGITGAAFPYLMRRKNISLEVFILMIIISINLTASWQGYSTDGFTIGAGCILAGLVIARISSKEKAYEK